MSAKDIRDPVYEQGILHTNFFEGRLLTAEDLRDQQNANREHDRRLGRAIGAGIIEGLEVELDNDHDGSDGDSAIVTVKKGLAINPQGEIIGLPNNDIKLALSRSLETVEVEQADFYTCAGPPGNQHLPSGVGIYILVMSPAATYKQRAPKSGITDNGFVKGCGSRYIQEGVQFRLVELSTDALINLDGNSEATKVLLKEDLLNENNPVTKSDLPRLSKLRNILAHLCFGTEKLQNFAIDPFNTKNGQSPYLSYGALDALRDLEELNDCDVPLSLLYWTLDGVAFLDLWSVRRNSFLSELSSALSLSTSPRSKAEAEAMFYQFQNHIDQLGFVHPNPSSIRAKDYFRYLPPAGLLQLKIKNISRYKSETFFNSFPHRSIPEYQDSFKQFLEKSPSLMDGNAVLAVIQQSFKHAVIDVTDDVLIWVYYPWQQIQALKREQNVDEYILFTVAYMSPVGIARFDISRWDFSNYTSCG